MTLLGERQRGSPVGQETAPHDDAARWAGLASRVGQGDRAAEAELAGLFHQRVRLFASVRLHGSDAASDIAQEAILAVIEALRAGRLRAPYNLPGFVLGTARNLVKTITGSRRGIRKSLRTRPIGPTRPTGNGPALTTSGAAWCARRWAG